jgi:hypothetical protein
MSVNKQSFREDVSANRSPNKSELDVDVSHRVDKNDKDSPDQFIKRMESTMSKKRKNNYKNIEELENIYDTKSKNKEYIDYSMEDSMGNYNREELSEAFAEMEESINKAFSPFNTKSADKKGGKKKNILEEEDTIEGFSNNDDYTQIYRPEYEYSGNNGMTDDEFDDLENDLMSGKIGMDDLYNLLLSGKITQEQYNRLRDLLLERNGGKNKSESTNRCSKWNKNCGEDGENAMEWIQSSIDDFIDLFQNYSKATTYLCTAMYKQVDGKLDGNPSNNPDDVSIIVNILDYLLMIPLSVFFAYNWFYIMFYKDPLDQPVKIEFSKIIMESLKGMLSRFFKCLVQPMILLDAFMRLVIPAIYFKGAKILKMFSIGKILVNPIFIFISLTFIMLYMVCVYSSTVSGMFYSYLKSSNIPYDSHLYCIVAFDLIIGIAALGFFTKAVNFIEILLNPITSLFWFLVLLIFSFVMIRFGGLFCISYLYAMSYLALIIYAPGGLSGGLNIVNIALEAGVTQTDKKCPPGWWEKIFIAILNSIYKYLYAVMYLIVLVYGVLWIFKDMKSSSGKIIFGSGLGLCIVIVIWIVLIIYLQGGTNVKKNDIDMPV